jgi:uncharacterized protein (TIGR00730 family)
MKQKQNTDHLDIMEKELAKNEFRVAIFGSARIKKNDKIYKRVFELAKRIGQEKLDVVTGGGPGLMEAANAGHEAGDPRHKSENIGLTIELPFEAKGNKFIEVRKHFDKFSGRLDHFMALSHAFVIMPGGIGTCLELFYTWQLVQVKHLNPVPIIVFGEMWEKLIDWVKEYPLEKGLISPQDTDNIYIVKSIDEAMDVINATHDKYIADGCLNGSCKKYTLES